jgi:hypothetical protein
MAGETQGTRTGETSLTKTRSTEALPLEMNANDTPRFKSQVSAETPHPKRNPTESRALSDQERAGPTIDPNHRRTTTHAPADKEREGPATARAEAGTKAAALR